MPPITLEPNGAHSNSKWGNSPTSGPSERESLALKEYNSQLRKKIDRLNIELNNLSAFVDTRAA